MEMILVIRVASGWVHSVIWDWLGRAGSDGGKGKVKRGVRPRQRAQRFRQMSGSRGVR